MTASRNDIQAQVELWGAEAKRLSDAGKTSEALDVYRRAADALPGAPWLQHRTAELARKLQRNDVAIAYFRRAALAFVGAGFEKRALAPLRAAWSLARQEMPRSLASFMEIARDLGDLQTRLGFAADASVTLEYTNDALRRAGVRDQVA